MEPIVSMRLGIHVEDTGSMRQVHLPARVFAILADLAWPVVKSYRSDLYHDTLWLAEHVTGEAAFFYGVRETGTSIGLDRDAAAAYNKHTYRVLVSPNDRNEYVCDVFES